MKSQIKSAKTFRLDYVLENPNEPELKTLEYMTALVQYDEEGNTQLEVSYNEQGNIVEKIENKYENGKLVENVMYDGEEQVERKTYEYDEQGRIRVHYLHYLDGSKDEVLYNYDENGNLIQRLTKDDEDYTELKEILEYEEGKLVKEQLFDGDENLKSERSFVLDKAGNIIEMTSWDDENDIRIKKMNEYNEDGKIIKSMIYNEAGDLIARESFKLDNKGQAVEIIDEDNSGLNTIYLVYDENGNVIDQEEYNSNDELNNKVNRRFNENNDILESDVYIDRHGEKINQHYIIRMVYEYYK